MKRFLISCILALLSLVCLAVVVHYGNQLPLTVNDTVVTRAQVNTAFGEQYRAYDTLIYGTIFLCGVCGWLVYLGAAHATYEPVEYKHHSHTRYEGDDEYNTSVQPWRCN